MTPAEHEQRQQAAAELCRRVASDADELRPRWAVRSAEEQARAKEELYRDLMRPEP